MNPNIWILIPVHNRCDLTRACLNNLRQLGEMERYRVCVIDDGSTDGTAEMLRMDFPAVHVIEGTGSLYWGGGIALGMESAHAQGAEVLVWLNDDCIPANGSIKNLVARVCKTHGICGAVCFDPADPARVTYSGACPGISGAANPPRGTFEPAHSLNGNLVAIHRKVIDAIGVIDHRHFLHYGGDMAYTITARRAGFQMEISGDATAINPRGRPFDRFGTTAPAMAILREPFRVNSVLYWPAYWHLLKLSCGWHACYRWPAYFLRLERLWLAAKRRERAVSVAETG